MSRRAQASQHSYSHLEDRRLLAADANLAGVSVVEETATLHIRPVMHAGMGQFQSDIDVVYDRDADEIRVLEHLPSAAYPQFPPASGEDGISIRTLSFDAAELESLVYIGTYGDDFFINNTSLDAYIRGRSGSDTLYGGWGNDKIFGGADDDRIDGGRGADRIQGDNGDDALFGGSGEDLIFGNAGNDTIEGGLPGEVPLVSCHSIPGTSHGEDCPHNEPDGDDTIHGGQGDDTLKGDQGNDRLFGHAGRDYIQGGTGDDVAFGGDGDDWILEIRTSNGLLLIDAGDDLIYGGDGNDELMGGLGNDRLFGQDGDDTIGNTTWFDTRTAQSAGNFEPSVAEGGDDFISGGKGADLIWGGLGNDRIRGGEGDDIISGAPVEPQPAVCALVAGVDCPAYLYDGNDFIHGDAGNDELSGGSQADTIFGGQGDDMIRGQDGRDYLHGQLGNDTVWGGYGGDYVLGGQGADKIFGDEGRDRLFGAIAEQNQSHGKDELDGGQDGDVMLVDLLDVVVKEESIDQVLTIFRQDSGF